MIESSFALQSIAPTEAGGRAHARLRYDVEAIGVGSVIVQTIEDQRTLGATHLGGKVAARVLVMSDGLAVGSGCPVYTPIMLLTKE